MSLRCFGRPSGGCMVAVALALYLPCAGRGDDSPSLSTAATLAPTSTIPASRSLDGAMPPLPGYLFALPDAAPSLTGPAHVHEGFMMSQEDLVPSQGWSDPALWLEPLTPAPGSLFEFTAAAAFPGRIKQALEAGTENMAGLEAGSIGDAFKLLKLVPGVTVTMPKDEDLTNPFFGYRPPRARWLKSRLLAAGATPSDPDRKYAYADYAGFDDVRLRGARLYCAARQAQLQANSETLSLGERVGFSLTLLGRKIDFLVVEPTVALNGPRAFPGPTEKGDGTRGFDIPWLLGTRVTPIRGLGIPGLGEARVPFDMLSGDSEVRTLAERQRIPTVPAGPFVIRHTKEYQTVAHADAFLSARFAKPFEAKGNFTLFYVGPVRVFGKLLLAYEVGASSVGNDRVWYGMPPATRQGRLFRNPLTGVSYHDGPWQRVSATSWQVRPDGLTDAFWRQPYVAATPNAYALRPLTNDDHVVDNATGLTLGLGLGGELGAEKGPFKAAFTVTGGVTGNVSQHTVVRHAVMGQDPVVPAKPSMRSMDGVTIRPRQTAKASFDGLEATAEMKIDLGFLGTVKVKKTLFKVGATTLAAYDSDNDLRTEDEEFMLRLAVGSGDGTPRTQPAVLSHLPQRKEFDSFPQNVATCLADADPLPPPPAPCEPEVDAGSPPRAEMCVYGPTGAFQKERLGSSLPPMVCARRGSYLASLGLTTPQRSCVSNYLRFLCGPVSKQQSFEGASVVSRVWNASLDPTLESVVRECASAFLKPSDTDAVKTRFAEGLASIGACRADATLLTGPEIVGGFPENVPPRPRPGACAK